MDEGHRLKALPSEILSRTMLVLAEQLAQDALTAASISYLIPAAV
jgi:hypothetical protein